MDFDKNRDILESNYLVLNNSTEIRCKEMKFVSISWSK